VYREFVLGGHMLAVGTASIAAASAIALGAVSTPFLLVMAYLFSYGAYMMNRSAEIDSDVISHPERTAHLSGRRRYLPVISAAYFLLGYLLAITVNLVFFLALLLPLALSLLYSVGSKRLVRVMGATKLKEKLLLKNVAISFGWSLIPLLVGLYFLKFELVLALFSFFIFLRLMVNTLIFDIRDVEGDKEQGIRTVPAVYGVGTTYRLMGALDLAGLAYVSILVAMKIFPGFMAILLVLPIYSLGYSALARQPGANLSYICDVVVDGEYLAWGPLMYIGAAIF